MRVRYGLPPPFLDSLWLAIVLEPVTELREGPGAHLPVAVRVQAGSRVRVLETRSGWARVRMPAGLEGWAPQEAIAELNGEAVRTRVRAARSETQGGDPGSQAGASPADTR